MEAARWIDASDDNRRETARILSRRAWLNTKEQYLTGRMLGEYDNGAGKRWQDAHAIRFFNEGGELPVALRRHVVFNPVPPLGPAEKRPDYAAIASRINRIDIWKDAATAIGNYAASTDHANQHADGWHSLGRYRPGALRQTLRHSTNRGLI
jgi:nitrate/nitrite transport system substrate-binding protein